LIVARSGQRNQKISPRNGISVKKKRSANKKFSHLKKH